MDAMYIHRRDSDGCGGDTPNIQGLTLGSLFDGSGGFPLGGLLSGVTPLWASEVEPFAICVTTKRLPQMKHYGDITALNGEELPPVDIITFGSPCQNMSIAGNRSGLKGEQSCLFYEAVRIVKEMRCATDGKYPRFIVWENVEGAFSSNKGEDFRCVLEEICKVKDSSLSVPAPDGRWAKAGEIMGDGFSVAWRLLDAQYWGVPQRRKRIYLVTDFADGCAGKILFESEGVSGYSAEGFRSWQRAANGAETGAGTAGGAVCLNDQGGERMDVSEDVAGTLRAQDHGHAPCVVESAGFCTEHSAKSRTIGYEEEMSPTLRAGVVPAVVGAYENHSQDTRYTELSDTAPTVSATYGSGGNNQPFVVENVKNYDVRFTSEGTRNARQNVYETETARTIDTGGNAPDSNQGGVAVVAYGICSKHSHSMLSDNPKSGFYEAETSRTLDGNGGNPTCNQGGIAVIEKPAAYTTGNSGCRQEDVSCTIDSSGGRPTHNQIGMAVIEGNGSRPSHKGDGYKESDVMYTLNCVEQHGVAYGVSRDNHFSCAEEQQPSIVARGPGAVATYCTSKNSHHTSAEKELANTLVATDYKDPPCVNDIKTASGKDVYGTLCASMATKQCLGNQEAFSGDYHIVEPDYIVRRLTPVECARLQGFPDWWCMGLETENPTDEELAFWREVFDAHARINGVKPRSDAQIIKWLKSPHSDSAEYRLWGNGICLSNAVFVLSGIVYYALNFTDDLV